MRLPWNRSLAVAAVTGLHLGCSAMLGDLAKEVTPGLVAGAVQGLADPETQRELVAAVDEGRTRTMSARLSAGIVDGLLDTLENPKRRARLEAIVNGLAARAAAAAFDSISDRAAGGNFEERMRAALRTTLVDVIDIGIETLGSKMGTPAERSVAIGLAAHEIAREATLGFQDALDKTRRDQDSGKMVEGDGSLLIAADNASAAGSRILWTLGLGLGTLALGLAITLIWAIRKNRLRRNELRQRDGALQSLTEAINATTTQPGAEDLRAALQTAMGRRLGDEHVRKALGMDRSK